MGNHLEVNSDAMNFPQEENVHNGYLEFENVDFDCPTIVKGRLRENISFWQNIGASKWVLRVLQEGYSLPFISLLQEAFFRNHPSAVEDVFVCTEISKLLLSGAVVEVESEDLVVCNPLGVVRNSAQKRRLIMDLRYVNQYLRSCKFKYDDIHTAADLFHKDDWFFKFDYKSGYHHIEIFPQHCKYLGFSLFYKGQLRFFKFTVLPFGLSTGPYLFTKIQRALVKHWRGKVFRLFTYLDDGAGADQDQGEVARLSAEVKRDVLLTGFVANEEKSQWDPVQGGERLGFIMDLRSGTFKVPPRRVDASKQLLNDIIAKKFVVSARHLSCITGSLVSMGLALGPVARLWTRTLYRDIYQTVHWDMPFLIFQESQAEV